MDIFNARSWLKALGVGGGGKPANAGAGGHVGQQAPIANVLHTQAAHLAHGSKKKPQTIPNPFEDGKAYQMRSVNIDIPEDAPVTVHNAEKLARIPRYPYKVVAANFERDQKWDQGRGSVRENHNISKAEETRLQDQWLRGIDIGIGWKPDRILGRGGNGIVGKFDWHRLENDAIDDREWELAVKSICVKQSRRGWSDGLKLEGAHMQELNSTGSKHFPTMYNYVKRTRGQNTEGLHIDNAEREVHQLIMEFCPGGDLGKLTELLYKKGEGLPEYAIWSIFICLAKAVKVMRDGTENPVDDFEMVDPTTPAASQGTTNPDAAIAVPSVPPQTFSGVLIQLTPPADSATTQTAAMISQDQRWRRKIHLDIKPENIFIGTKGIANDLTSHSYAPIHKVADFGLMIHEEDVFTARKRKALFDYGTATFIPPEQDPKHFQDILEWKYTTRMNVYNVGCVIWCIMLRLRWPFGDHSHEFGLATLQRENRETMSIKTRGRSIISGDRPRLDANGNVCSGSERLANYEYSNDLKVLVRQCLALEYVDRPGEDELLRRTISGFNIAKGAYMARNPRTTIPQMEREFDRLISSEPVQSSPGDSLRKIKAQLPARPKTPSRMHREPPPGYWKPVVAEDVRIYHEMNRPRWDKRDAQIVAARKLIRRRPNIVVGDFKDYARDIAINRQIERKRGCDREDNSADERDINSPGSDNGSDVTEIDYTALPTSRGPRIRMGFDGRPHEDKWYLPSKKRRKQMNTDQFNEAKAKKLEEIIRERRKRFDSLLHAQQPTPEDSRVEADVAPRGRQLQQPPHGQDWRAAWGGAPYVSAAKAKKKNLVKLPRYAAGNFFGKKAKGPVPDPRGPQSPSDSRLNPQRPGQKAGGQFPVPLLHPQPRHVPQAQVLSPRAPLPGEQRAGSIEPFPRLQRGIVTRQNARERGRAAPRGVARGGVVKPAAPSRMEQRRRGSPVGRGNR